MKLEEVVGVTVRPFQPGDIIFLQCRANLTIEGYTRLREITEKEEARCGVKIIIIDAMLQVIGKPEGS